MKALLNSQFKSLKFNIPSYDNDGNQSNIKPLRSSFYHGKKHSRFKLNMTSGDPQRKVVK
jgi:hypothetical protein